MFGVQNEQSRVEGASRLHGRHELTQACINLSECLSQICGRCEVGVIAIPGLRHQRRSRSRIYSRLLRDGDCLKVAAIH